MDLKYYKIQFGYNWNVLVYYTVHTGNARQTVKIEVIWIFFRQGYKIVFWHINEKDDSIASIGAVTFFF